MTRRATANHFPLGRAALTTVHSAVRAWLALGLGLMGCGPDEDIHINGGFGDEPMVPPAQTSSCSLDGVIFEATPQTPSSADSSRAETPSAERAATPDPAAADRAPDPRPFFSFFVTSQAGLYRLPAGEFAPRPDPANGYGGDFGGLAGADEICSQLAQRSNPGDTKVWRAFLSSSGTVAGERVDAIGRIGRGPWYDYNGRLLARDLAGLLPDESGRPSAAEPQLGDMFTDENGENARLPGQDNHDTLTGSNSCGRLFVDGVSGRIATCEDWTSKTLHGAQANLGGFGGQVPVGHSWPRAMGGFGDQPALGAHWIQDHTINGCEPGFDVDGGMGAPADDFRVGGGGGYGGFYCFALGAVPPAM